MDGIFRRTTLFVGVSRDAMFRAEQRHQLHARRVREQVDGGPALRIHARVIGDQSNTLAAQWREFLGFQHVQARLHAALRGFAPRFVSLRAAVPARAANRPSSGRNWQRHEKQELPSSNPCSNFADSFISSQ